MANYTGVLTGFLSSEGGIVGNLSAEGNLQGTISYPTSVVVDVYTGAYIVDPNFVDQTLETQDKLMEDDVTINAIKVTRTSNLSGGLTVVIG